MSDDTGSARSGLLRRDVLKASAAGIAFAAVGAVPHFARAAEELNVIAWCDNTTPDLLKPFEEDTGVRVNGKEYDGTSAALSILEQSSPGDWDVFVVDSVEVGNMVKRGLLMELNPADYPLSDVFPEILSPTLHQVNGKTYGIPEKFGYNAVAFNKEKVDLADMRTIESFWNPKYKGRIAVYDGYLPVIELVGLGIGIKPNALKASDLPAIREKLLAMKKLVSVIGDIPTIQNALATGSADVIVGGAEITVAGLYKDHPMFDWTIPDQGGIRWIQALAIVASTNRKDLAAKFLRYVMSPEGQARLATSSCFWGMPTSRKAALNDEQKKVLRWDDQPKYVANSYDTFTPPPDLDRAMTDLWAEFLSA